VGRISQVEDSFIILSPADPSTQDYREISHAEVEYWYTPPAVFLHLPLSKFNEKKVDCTGYVVG
jgi:hypothetical protein